MPGANVLEIGAKNGVQTDFDGSSALTVSGENAVLSISFVGFVNTGGVINQNRGYIGAGNNIAPQEVIDEEQQ